MLEDWMRDQYLKRGYSLVYTPHVARVDLWKTSGHAELLRREHVHAAWSWTTPSTSSSR